MEEKRPVSQIWIKSRTKINVLSHRPVFKLRLIIQHFPKQPYEGHEMFTWLNKIKVNRLKQSYEVKNKNKEQL